MWWCVVGRLLAIPVFLQHGGPWLNVALFEGVCGLSVVTALLFESREIFEKGKKAA